MNTKRESANVMNSENMTPGTRNSNSSPSPPRKWISYVLAEWKRAHDRIDCSKSPVMWVGSFFFESSCFPIIFFLSVLLGTFTDAVIVLNQILRLNRLALDSTSRDQTQSKPLKVLNRQFTAGVLLSYLGLATPFQKSRSSRAAILSIPFGKVSEQDRNIKRKS